MPMAEESKLRRSIRTELVFRLFSVECSKRIYFASKIEFLIVSCNIHGQLRKTPQKFLKMPKKGLGHRIFTAPLSTSTPWQRVNAHVGALFMSPLGWPRT